MNLLAPALGLLLAFTLDPVNAADVRIALPGGGALVLPAPAGWQHSGHPGPLPTLKFGPASGNAFAVMVSPLVQPGGGLAPADKSSIRQLVERGMGSAKPHAVESTLTIQDLRSASVSGQYFSATDRAPKPGEFKYMTQGAAAVQGLAFAFTVLSNGDPKAAVEPALRMLQAARRE